MFFKVFRPQKLSKKLYKILFLGGGGAFFPGAFFLAPKICHLFSNKLILLKESAKGTGTNPSFLFK